jgi:hypothetical protein
MIGRVAHEQLAPEGDHRRLGFRHPELLEQLLHLRVMIDVQPRQRHAVFGQKLPNSEGFTRALRADHAQTADFSRLPQELPPCEKSLQDDIGDNG